MNLGHNSPQMSDQNGRALVFSMSLTGQMSHSLSHFDKVKEQQSASLYVLRHKSQDNSVLEGTEFPEL